MYGSIYVCVCIREYQRGKYLCTIDLLFDLFGLVCFANKTKIVRCYTAYSKPVKQEVNGTGMLPPLVFPGMYVCMFVCVSLHSPSIHQIFEIRIFKNKFPKNSKPNLSRTEPTEICCQCFKTFFAGEK
jgi:hypothetical protein